MARRSSATPSRCATWLLSLCLALLLPSGALAASASTYTFFQGTQYPLTVVHIQGDQPGPTVMVQGGIQGDEICGAVTAQLLTGCRLLKGNLIVVPRANLPSIHLQQRQVNVDMNRRFDRDYNRFYEDRVARVIRHLLAGCDGFIHLHEGSGFYSPRQVNALRNPNRYGQSIIVDAEAHAGVDLGGLVRGVLAELNPTVEPAEYRLELFDTRTFDTGTRYPEMRKSLTYYALSVLHIPAVAVEVSKNIRDIGWKVRTQMAATRLLLAHLGVETAMPDFDEADVQAAARVASAVRVNGSPLVPGSRIRLARGATITAESGSGPGRTYSPAVAVFASDRPGVNLLTTPRLALESFSGLEVRADGKPVAQVRVDWEAGRPAAPEGDGPVFACWLNGRLVYVKNGETLCAVAGDQFVIEGIRGGSRREVLNLKGYTANPWENDGQDVGAEIILDPDNFMDKYRQRADVPGAVRYAVVRETPGAPKASFDLEIEPRRVEALRLRDHFGREVEIPFSAGSEYRLPEGEYELLGARTNGEPGKLMATAGGEPVIEGRKLQVGGAPVEITLRQATTFQEMGTLTLSPGRWAELAPAAEARSMP
ncbi:MAG TPA: M99 family carboxypeptidase catalytic domain-containing protein [Desulfovibrio sp.]|uniref:M99 family carboxypeptidase catalytic domain-containing protein n=1 Tax=Desulfovibrio sp. TaxID=885 RepID=UPI002B5632E7|nr:M99 family carboxypeptidase catalytic domain-containing protein [Desulfovibrio sp.]HMM38421.1 M99 family carboxypeptidase catalytic domain-containing protein [Desulfovibrio sp.]